MKNKGKSLYMEISFSLQILKFMRWYEQDNSLGLDLS